jgi:fucose 4-O-acetylase-like acetyltransferase
MRDRLPGADVLRVAALFSIVLFHIVLEDAQFARAAATPVNSYDALLVISTIFDNRTLAIVSFLLLLTRDDNLSYGATIARRARRLLVPYFAWTSIYPFLDLGLAAARGQSHAYLARISDVAFWLSGYFLAATTPHLHFLPTLFLLTLIFPFYRRDMPLAVVIALLAAASAVRVLVEFIVIGDKFAPTIRDFAVLSGARLFEYLPLGLVAFVLSKDTTKKAGRLGWKTSAATIAVLVLASIAMKPAYFLDATGMITERLIWFVTQAILGAVIMCVAARATLAFGNTVAEKSIARELGQAFSERSFGVFLLHPFFIETFDTIIGMPKAYDPLLIAPKLLFSLICALLASSVLIQTKGLRTIV